jgi:hypothetical protein
MSTVLATHGYEVVSTDVADRGFGTAGVGYLTCRNVPGGCRSIITNPPYIDSDTNEKQNRSSTVMLDFLRHASALTKAIQGQPALLM